MAEHPLSKREVMGSNPIGGFFSSCYAALHVQARPTNKLVVANISLIKCKSGEAGHRSQCLSHAKRALYHLSYIPMPEHQQVSRCWGLRAPWGIIAPRRHRAPRPSPCNTSKLSRQAHRTEQKRCACRESNPGHKHGRLV